MQRPLKSRSYFYAEKWRMNMFEYFKLKKTKLQLEVMLLNKIYEATKLFDKGIDTSTVLEMANKLKGIKEEDFVHELAAMIHDENKKPEE